MADLELIGVRAVIADLQKYIQGGKQIEQADASIVKASQAVEVASAKMQGTWSKEQQMALQLSNAQKQLASAQSASAKETSAGSQAFGTAAKAVGGLLATYLSYSAVKNAVKVTQELGEETYKLANLTGLSAEQASSLINVADDLGVSFGQLQAGLRLFERNLLSVQEDEIGFAAASKTGAQVLESMGVAATDAAGKVRPLPNLLSDIADWFQKSTDATEAAGVAAQLFGRSGTALLPILKLGSAGLREAEASAKKLHIQLTTENVASIHEFTLAQADAGDALAGLQVGLGTKLLPVLTSFFNLIVANQDTIFKVFDGAEKAVISFASDAGTGLKAISDGLNFITGNKGTIILAVSAIGLAMAAAFGPASLAVAGLLLVVKLIGQIKGISAGTLTGAEKTQLQAQAKQIVSTQSPEDVQRKITTLRNDGSKEGKIAADLLAGALKKQTAETKAAAEASSGLGKISATTAQIQDALKDKIISFAEAEELGLSAAQAGRYEGLQAIKDAEDEGKKSAFDYAATIAAVSTAFSQSARAGQNLQLGSNRAALKGEQTAASSLFSRPTVEVAGLQLALDQVKLAHMQLRPAIEDDKEAHEQAAKDIEDAGEDQARAMEDAAEATANSFGRLEDAIDAEIANLQDSLTQLDRTFENQAQKAADIAKQEQRAAEDRQRDARNANRNAENSLQDELDALQERRSKIPSGKEGDSARARLDKQIDALQDEVKGLSRSFDDYQSNLQDFNTQQSRALDDAQEKVDRNKKLQEEQIQDAIAFKEKQKKEIEDRAQKSAEASAAAQKQLEDDTRVKAGLAKDQAEVDARKLKQFDREEKAIETQIGIYTQQSKIWQDMVTLADRTLQTQESQRQGAFILASQIFVTSGNVRTLSDKLGLNLIPEIDEANRLYGLANAAMTVTAETSVPNFNKAVDDAAAAAVDAANRMHQAALTWAQGTDALNGGGQSGGGAGGGGGRSFDVGGLTGSFGGPQRVTVHPNEAILPLSNVRRSREILASLPPGTYAALTQGLQEGRGIGDINIDVAGETLETTYARAKQGLDRAFEDAASRSVRAGALLSNGLG